MKPLPAKVIRVRGPFFYIECPYCAQTHEHKVINLGKRERRAAACNFYAPTRPEQRAAGYTFTTRREQ